MTDRPRSLKTEIPLTEDSDIEQLADEFEKLTLPYKNWTHRTHLALAVYYLRRLSTEDALTEMRTRINAYNVSCGDPNGYNETVTVLFLRKIASEQALRPSLMTMHEEVARLEVLCSVDWIYQFYSPELIWSPEAKKCWVNPDKLRLDF